MKRLLGKAKNFYCDIPQNEIQLLYGISLLFEENHEGSEKQLSELIETSLKDEANWYLGLNAMKAKDLKKANKYFEEVAKSNGYYAKKAIEILKEI